MANGLPYIKNKRLFQAVSFSLTMQRNGVHPDVADSKAAEYYGCVAFQVASYTEAAPPWMKGKGEPPGGREAQPCLCPQEIGSPRTGLS